MINTSLCQPSLQLVLLAPAWSTSVPPTFAEFVRDHSFECRSCVRHGRPSRDVDVAALSRYLAVQPSRELRRWWHSPASVFPWWITGSFGGSVPAAVCVFRTAPRFPQHTEECWWQLFSLGQVMYLQNPLCWRQPKELLALARPWSRSLVIVASFELILSRYLNCFIELRGWQLMVIWVGFTLRVESFDKGPLRVRGLIEWQSSLCEVADHRLENFLCVCQRCTILSKEQLRDQLVDRLGCREEETEIVAALSSGLVRSFLWEERLTWGGSWTWHLPCHSTARSARDPLSRLAVPPFLVWPATFLQIQFSSPAVNWCQLLQLCPSFLYCRLDIESDFGLNQPVVCVLQSAVSMTLVHSTSQRCLWRTRT